MPPRPARVEYNDWRQVELPAAAAFEPTLPVSVIIPCWNLAAGTLAMTLAALEGQTWPRSLFEVVIVDDGSEPALEPPRTTLDVRVVRQERRGFGTNRARNAGVRAARHGILLFLDGDALVERNWIAAHARWHHVVSDVLTIGFRACAAMDDLDAAAVRSRPGSLAELLSGRPVDPPWIEGAMLRTGDLTSRSDDAFRAAEGGNVGVARRFYDLVGGFDESWTRPGMDDTEFFYRVHARGALLAPVRDALAWHQGRWAVDRDAKNRSLRLQRRKAAHLIAHPGFRGDHPGRIYAVPQYVVTIDDPGRLPTDRLIEAVENLLADRVHDLVVRVDARAPDDGERATQLREAFGPDPRVRIGDGRSALDEFPVSRFHVTLPAAVFARGLVRRLSARLGTAVTLSGTLPGGARVTMTRTWALHRARRGGGVPADFGEARTIAARRLKLVTPASVRSAGRLAEDPFSGWARLRRAWGDVRAVTDAPRLVRWLGYEARRALGGGRVTAGIRGGGGGVIAGTAHAPSSPLFSGSEAYVADGGAARRGARTSRRTDCRARR